ncbi:MAG: hypothetical protein V4549_07445 [Bacteroidota bacterium]
MALLTARQIQTINIARSAIPGMLYHGTDGKTFQGQVDRKLLEYQPAVTSSFIPTATNKEVNVQKAIENISVAVAGASLKEIPLLSGVINGINTVFVWKYVPLIVNYNGQILREGVGYTISGTVTTLANAPFIGELVWAYGNY